MTPATVVYDDRTMRWFEGLDPYTKFIVVGAVATSIVAGVIIAWSTEWWAFGPGAVSGAIPWACAGLLRPRFVIERRLPPPVSICVVLTGVLAVGAMIWLVVAFVTEFNSDTAAWFAAAFVAIAVALVVGAASRTVAWFPAALAVVVVAGSLVALLVTGVWAASCPDCGVHPYHDPPTRAFMLFVWTLLGAYIASGYTATLVLFTYAARLVTRDAAA